MPGYGAMSTRQTELSASSLNESHSSSWENTNQYSMPQVCLHVCGAYRHANTSSSQADCGDYVVVTNTKKVKVSGRKEDQMLYRKHSMYPGGLKEIKYKDMMKRKPDEVRNTMLYGLKSPELIVFTTILQIIRQAVSGMLPKNKLRERRLERLRIFPNDDMGIFQHNIVKRWEDGTLTSTPQNVSRVPATASVQ
jgi:large subunit ribosomal protein L13